MKNIKQRKRKRYIGLFTAVLLATAVALPAYAAENESISVPSGQTAFSVDLYVDEAIPYAGIEFGLKLSDESALKFTSFQQSDAVKGAQASPFITRRGIRYFGFYTASNVYSGEMKAGTLHFTYTGDAPQTITIAEMEVFRIIEGNSAAGTKKPSPVFTITVERAPDEPGENDGDPSDPKGGEDPPDDGAPAGGEGAGGTTGRDGGGTKAIVIGGGMPPENIKPKSDYFDDVDEKWRWAVNSIDYLYESGVVEGTSQRTYSPGAYIKRGDFMLMLVRAFDLRAEINGSFDDVPEGTYYYEAVAVAKALGIALGDGGKFDPESPVTRQDMMALIDRTLRMMGKSLPEGSEEDLRVFADGEEISEYAKASAAALVKAGIIEGDGDRISPLSGASRAEIAVVLYRILLKLS